MIANRIIPLCLALAALVIGCSGSEESTKTRSQLLTPQYNRILGFEDPAADWSASNGSSITSSFSVSEGSASLSITPNGYTQITSVTLTAPGSATSSATLDIQLPSQLSWGEARLIVRAPSQGHGWWDLGGVNLQTIAPGAFRTLTFSLPQQIQDTLNSAASDISFVVVLNAPSGIGPILLDNLVVSSGTGGGTEAGSSESVVFSLSVPRGTPVSEVMLSATSKLTIDDRSTLGEEGELTTIASIGPETTEFGGVVQAYSEVISEGDVDFLRSQSTVYGHITTEGSVLIQDASVNTPGGITEGASITSASTTWSVDWPLELAEPITLPPDAPNRTLAPGGYRSLVAYSRSTVTLNSGTYFFDSLVLEPEAHFQISASSGPVLIYVRETLRLNVGLDYLSGEEGEVLFGYLGTEAPLFREGLSASVVAPNASIELRRPSSGAPFRGSFFGKEVHVFSDATVQHIPLDWAFVCPLGDFDGDGVFDCFDSCRFNPAKVDPGVCGCLKAEDDTDGDGVPDCKDACPADSGDVYDGTCGCPSDPAPEGKPCFDGICFGNRQTCDGSGRCGDLSCRPHPSCRALYSSSNDKFYWVCDHQVSRDEAKLLCANQDGSKLASVSEAEINRLLSSNATTDVWIGANSLAAQGEWHWLDYTTDTGRKFWSGGAAGGAVFARFNAFGAPPSDEAECASLGTDGSWTARDCLEAHGFVCEISNDRLVKWPPDEPERAGPIVGIPPYQPPGDDCVDPETWFGDADSEAEVLALFEQCETCLEDNGEDACDDVCVGPAAIPDEDARCTLEGDGIAVSNASCNEDPLPAALDEGGNEIPCSASEDCIAEPPPEAVTCERSADCTRANEQCISKHCVVVLMCDTRAGHCVVPDDSCAAGEDTLPEQCGEVELCEPAPTQTTTTIEAGSADLQPRPSNPEDFFGEEPEIPEEIPPYDGESCEGCGSLSASQHPWCRIDLEAGDALPAQGNESEQNGTNDGDKIKFRFEPVFEFRQDADLGALGIPTIDLRAAAGLNAAVEVNFAGNPRFEIIDALGELDTTQCGIHGDVTLEIFGKNIIESYKEENGLPFDIPANTCAEDDEDCLTPAEQCEKAFTQFRQGVDRAEKAMRDAAELMRQYRDAVRNGAKLPDDLCRSVIPDSARPRGFPEGFCPAEGETETPEQTIQRFVDYYRMAIVGFGEKKLTEGALSLNDYAQSLIDYLPPNPSGEIELADFSPEPTKTTIIAAQFFIGPIPAFLEVGSTVDYGVLVTARAGLRVGELVGQILDFSSVEANSTEAAYAGVSGAPYAGAGLYMFAGVGFGIPGFKVQIGVQGDVHLGTISLPAYAGAGLWIGSQADARDAPASLSDFATNGYLIPRKIYSAQLGYTAGLEAQVRDVLSGSIAGKIKLKVLFFSKTWKATILKFNGICNHVNEEPDGSLDGCDFPIFSVSGQAIAAEGAFGWGFVKMPTSFPGLSLPSREEILAELAVENGETEIPEVPLLEDLPVQSFSTSRVNAVLYDQFCDECLEPGVLPEYPEDDCFSSADCCEENNICYEYNTFGDNFRRRECRSCGDARGTTGTPDTGECYLDEHCCEQVLTSTGEKYGGICYRGECRTGLCTSCVKNSDCAPNRVCGPPTGGGAFICLAKNEDGSINHSSCQAGPR